MTHVLPKVEMMGLATQEMDVGVQSSCSKIFLSSRSIIAAFFGVQILCERLETGHEATFYGARSKCDR